MQSPETTRERIVEAAFSLFAEQGYAGTTTREIAERAEVNEVTLFRHFRSKSALFQDAIGQHSPVSLLSENLEERLTGDLRADLRQLADQYLEAALPQASVIHLGFVDAARDPELQRIVRQIPLRLQEHLAAHLRVLHAQGKVCARDFQLVAHLFYSLLFQHVLSTSSQHSCAPAPPKEPDVVAESVADLFTSYLRPPTFGIPEDVATEL